MLKKEVLAILVCSLAICMSLSAQNNQALTAINIYADVDTDFNADRAEESTDICYLICGDANYSETINILDVTYLINFLYKDGPEPIAFKLGDANSSGNINILDATFLIAYLYKDGTAPDGYPPLIEIVNLHPGDYIVNGTANISDTSTTRVVLWAKTDRWYVQPTIGEPFTIIQSDGTWSNYTNPWNRIVALLVSSSYVPGSTRDYHPSQDPGVICWDEYPDRSLKYINWSNYRWRIKNADLIDPGPNYFSDDTSNVMVDQEGRMHLKIDHRDDRWYCAELVLDHSLGYGVYKFKVDSRIDSLDYNSIFAGFIYETTNQEFDIEFSQRLAAPFNAQYVAQPWYTPGNIEFFNMPVSSQTSHSFEWRPDRIVFNSWNGHSDSPTLTTLIHSWTYTGGDIPIPGNERMIFNLYLFGGETPVQGIEDEVIITSFEYSD